jgi:hypothetical protein
MTPLTENKNKPTCKVSFRLHHSLLMSFVPKFRHNTLNVRYTQFVKDI